MSSENSGHQFREALDRAHQYFQPFTCPLFGVNDRGRPELTGSGVLLQAASMFFILSAAHVLDEGENTTVYSAGKDSLVEVKGFGHRITMPPLGRNHDLVDLGFVRLHDSSVSELLHRHRFLTAAALDVSGLPQSVSRYAFIGYPATKNETMPHFRVKRGGLMISAIPSDLAVYKQEDLRPEIHVIGNFDREHMADSNGRLRTSPDPHGMSGGAIWRWQSGEDLLRPVETGKVVAISVEWRKASKILVGVRVSLLIAMILEVFPHLSATLPTPCIKGINIKITNSVSARNILSDRENESESAR